MHTSGILYAVSFVLYFIIIIIHFSQIFNGFKKEFCFHSSFGQYR